MGAQAMARSPIEAAHWWRSPWALERFMADLIDAEARRMRPGGPWPPRTDPKRLVATAPDESGIGFDSLERLGLAAALSESLHLHAGGLEDTLLTAPTFAGWLEAAAKALDRSGERVTVRSSGSTGKARSHVHSTMRLDEEASAWAALLPGRRRVRSAVASHHIYGLLFTLLAPHRLGLPVDDLRPLSPGSVVATLKPGDLVIGHPMFWDALLRAAPSGWPNDVVGITSGAACADDTAAGLMDAGLDRLLDVYGASETAGIGWRERRRDGWVEGNGAHRLAPWWRRGDDGRLARPGDGPVSPPDVLTWEDPGHFRIGARLDGAVMVGGVAVDPGRVRDVLRAHPGVADAAVRLMRPSEGVRLKAFLTRRDAAEDPEVFLAAVNRHIEAALTAPERPRALRLGSAIPVTASGKPADWPV